MTDNITKKPAPPKRPQCAFFIYKQEVYPQVRQGNPGKKMTDITKVISEMYKNLPKEKIEECEQKYKDSKVIFEKSKKEYEELYGKIKNEKRKKRKTDKGEKGEKVEKKTKKQLPKTKSEKKGQKSVDTAEAKVPSGDEEEKCPDDEEEDQEEDQE